MSARPRWLTIDPFWWLVGGLLAVVLLYLRRTTQGLYWPFDLDLYRDIGQAEAVLQGRLVTDFHYRGEAAWYNPLVAWIVAAGAKVTGLSASRVATQGGVVLNLLAPLVLAILVRRWFGRLAAGFALVAYIFLLVGDWPSWAIATYSPWLFTANFAQGVFFVGLLALPGAVDDDRPRAGIVFGALLGLVALAHTAPALILLVVFLVVLAWRTLAQRRPVVPALKRVAFVGVPAAVVAAPFMVPLAWRYQFEWRNENFWSWIWEELRPEQVWDFLGRFGWRWPVVVALVAPVVWWVQRRKRPLDVPTMALIAWTVVSALGLAFSVYADSANPGAGSIPQVVPSYHFMRYLTAALAVWFGLGVAALIRLLPSAVIGRRAVLPALATGIACVMVVVTLPEWTGRSENHGGRAQALQQAASFNRFEASRWIGETTDRDAVVLYDLDPVEALISGPLDGRPTVVVEPVFSNPYVAWQPRAQDAATMVAALRNCARPEGGDELFERYGVTHVFTSAQGPLVTAAAQCPALEVVYADPYAAVIAVADERLP